MWLIDARRMAKLRFQPDGRAARTASTRAATPRCLYVTNRGEGIDLAALVPHPPPDCASGGCPAAARPDMGGVSADGRVLWLSGRYDAEVYAISTRTGRLLHRIPVGRGPHGLCVWPQPGRYSLGHTGILR